MESDDPGEIVYADEYQIGVRPAVRESPTPLPEGIARGPTSAGPKRTYAWHEANRRGPAGR